MSAIPISPIQQKQRTAIIDILRGWALLGVVLMNYADYSFLGLDWKTYKPGLPTNILMGFANIIFAAKSWTMLSFLFGYGFAVLMKNIEQKGMNPVGFFSRRMFWLLMLGVINSALFFGDILKDYALMGMVLLLFYRASAKTAFICFVVLMLAVPAISGWVNTLPGQGGFDALVPIMPYLQSSNIFKVFYFELLGTVRFEFLNPGYAITVHFMMLACFMLGLAAQRAAFFTNIAENKKYVKRIFWGSLAFVILVGAFFFIASKMKISLKYYQPGFWVLMGSMIFIASAICWLYIAGKLKAFFRSMQVIGRMTLTNYLTQNVLALVLFSGVGFGFVGDKRLDYGYYLLFGFVIYVTQVYFSKWWLARYQFGPVEWIWRQLSYNKRFNNAKPQVSEEEISRALSVQPVLAKEGIINPPHIESTT